jgi:hypothetical protein
MNWGKWIVVSFLLFAGLMTTIVTISMKQDVNLVSSQYYQDDLDFQQQLVRKNNTETLLVKPEIIITEKKLQVNFPKETYVESGVIKLFRPSTDKLDQNFVLQPSKESMQVFILKTLDRGAYRVKMTWRVGDKEYYLEKFVVV